MQCRARTQSELDGLIKGVRFTVNVSWQVFVWWVMLPPPSSKWQVRGERVIWQF